MEGKPIETSDKISGLPPMKDIAAMPGIELCLPFAGNYRTFFDENRRLPVTWSHLSPNCLSAVDPVIVGELRFGILILPVGRRRAALENWFDGGVGRLRCLPWEAETGLKWAELQVSLRTAGKAMPIQDSLIAATAVVQNLAVAP